MEILKDMRERKIMPQDLLECYIRARTDTYASGKEPVLGLNIPGFKGYREEVYPYFYQDNYVDNKRRPGNFGGFELITDGSCDGDKLTFYTYAGGLTEEGLKLGEKAVYSKLTEFLRDHVAEVRFGKKVKFTIEDESGTWVYEDDGEVKPWGWEDKEKISHNGVLLYELNGNGACFIRILVS